MASTKVDDYLIVASLRHDYFYHYNLLICRSNLICPFKFANINFMLNKKNIQFDCVISDSSIDWLKRLSINIYGDLLIIYKRQIEGTWRCLKLSMYIFAKQWFKQHFVFFSKLQRAIKLVYKIISTRGYLNRCLSKEYAQVLYILTCRKNYSTLVGWGFACSGVFHGTEPFGVLRPGRTALHSLIISLQNNF